MSALPYPTLTRLAVAEEIAKGFIRWYNFDTPQAFHTVTGFKYTAALDELVKAGLARVPSCPEGSSSVAQLTDLAARWRAGSTSPEPGPEAHICCKGIADGGGHAQWCGEVAPDVR